MDVISLYTPVRDSKSHSLSYLDLLSVAFEKSSTCNFASCTTLPKTLSQDGLTHISVPSLQLKFVINVRMKAALVQIRVGIAFWLARHASGAPMQLGWIDEAMRSRSTFVASHGGGGNAHATEYMNVAPLPANVQLSSGISSMYERLANAEMRRRLSEKLFGRPKVGSRHKKKSKHREILQDPGDVEQKSEETEKKSTPLVPPSTTTPGLEGTTEPSGDTNPLGKQVAMNPEIGDPQAPSTSPPHEVVQGEVHPGTKMGRKLGGTPADPKKQVSGNQHVQKAPPPPRVKEASPPQQQGGGQPKQEKK